MTARRRCPDPLGDPNRDPRRPYTVADLCTVTGWSRPTVIGAIQAGTLPGYQSCHGGRYTIPAAAFRAVCDGSWQSRPRELTITPAPPMLHSVAKRRAS